MSIVRASMSASSRQAEACAALREAEKLRPKKFALRELDSLSRQG
jgi:hypothetical protein